MDSRIKYSVVEVDEQTETTIVIIEGDHIQFDVVLETINSMGATIHSIDEVEVVGLQTVS